MAFVRTVLLIAVLLLGWVAMRGGLNPSSAAVIPPGPTATLPIVAPAQPPP